MKKVGAAERYTFDLNMFSHDLLEIDTALLETSCLGEGSRM